MPAFPEGSTVVRRDVLDGRVWSAAPHRVLRDDGGELLLAYWPGIRSLAPSTWIDWLRTGDDAIRKSGLPALARRDWRLGHWTWRDTGLLSWLGVDPDFCVCRFFDLSGHPLRWYVNFERTPRRTPSGVDTFDLMVDMVIAADGSAWRWKDEDEYAQARRLGVIGDAEHRRVSAARERAVALVEGRGGPFGEDWSSWRPAPEWPVPVLPPALPHRPPDYP